MQVKPGKASGRRPRPAKLIRRGGNSMSQLVRCLRRTNGSGVLAKLNCATPILVAGHYELSAQFREPTARPPERLAFLHSPARSVA